MIAFVTKLAADGRSLVYSTFLGGNGIDVGYGIGIDASGCAYVTGYTRSSDFPTTSGAYDTDFNEEQDVFVTKLSADGSSLVYSTFLGGSDGDIARDIAVDLEGCAYIIGETFSSDFPTTLDAYDTTHNGDWDVFVTKLDLTRQDETTEDETAEDETAEDEKTVIPMPSLPTHIGVVAIAAAMLMRKRKIGGP